MVVVQRLLAGAGEEHRQARSRRIVFLHLACIYDQLRQPVALVILWRTALGRSVGRGVWPPKRIVAEGGWRSE
jgi:hypothetical protein